MAQEGGEMKHQNLFSAFLIVALSFIVFGCEKAEKPAENLSLQGENGLTIHTEIISVDQLPEFDPDRTFRYQYNTENPEGILIALWNAGIPVAQAWFALDDQCLNPIGPRLTVELSQDDERILQQGFERGVGMLQCATELKHFILTD